MLGYEGYAKIGGIAVLVTASNTSIERNRLDSGGAYGAGYQNAIGNPHIYDYPGFSGSISFEVHSGIISFIQARVNNRKSPFEFNLYTGVNGHQIITNAYWTSLSVGASTDSPVVCSISFMATLRDSYTLPSGYFGNDGGVMSLSDFQSTDELDTANNTSPIPFWNTSIGGANQVATWSIAINQDFQKIFGCPGVITSDPQNPRNLGITILNGQFDFTCYLLTDEGEDSGAIGGSASDIKNDFGFTAGNPTSNRESFTINLAGSTLFTVSGEVINPSNPLAGISNITTVERSYQLYSISA